MSPLGASTPPAHLPQRPPTAARKEVVCSSVSIESTASDAYGIAKTEPRQLHALRRGLGRAAGWWQGCGAVYRVHSDPSRGHTSPASAGSEANVVTG